MPFQFANNASAKLASAITSSDVTLNVVTGQGAQFPTPSGGSVFRATLKSSTAQEIVEVTARSSDSFTIVRAKEGTTAVGFAAGDTLNLFLTKEVMENFVQLGGADEEDTLIDALGDLLYGSADDTFAKLSGNTTATKKFLTQTGTGAVSAAPAWNAIGTTDIPAHAVVGTESAGDNSTKAASTAYADNAVAKQPETLMFAVSDESTAITTGTAKLTFRMPFACSMTALPRANVNTVSSSGAPAVDINKNGASIFSTTLTIDASEKTSVTAATPAVLASSPTTFADDDEITIDIDTAGTGTKGLKITMNVVRT